MTSRFITVCAVLTVAAASIFTSCSKPEPTLAEKAIIEHINKTMGEVTSLTFIKLEKIDSTAFDREIAMRKAIFKTKLQQDELYLARYTSMRVADKIAEKKSEIEVDKRHVSQMDSLKYTLKNQLKDVAYYDYCFSVKGKANGEKFVAEDWYVCMTPDGRIINFVQDVKQLHKGTGVSIPGYSKIFGDKDEAYATTSR